MRLLASMSLFAALSAAALAANASTITSLSDNFSGTTLGLGRTGVLDSSFSTVNNTNVDVLGGGLFGYLCTPTSANCIDLGGTTNGSNGSDQGVLQSTSMFDAGTYYLTFNLTGPGRGVSASTEVTFGNYDATFSLYDTAGNTGPSNQFVILTTPGYLTFTDLTPGNAGDILNSVSVSQVSSVAATPEPSSIMLLGSGLMAGAGMLARRRR